LESVMSGVTGKLETKVKLLAYNCRKNNGGARIVLKARKGRKNGAGAKNNSTSSGERKRDRRRRSRPRGQSIMSRRRSGNVSRLREKREGRKQGGCRAA